MKQRREFDGDFTNGKFRVTTRDEYGTPILVAQGTFEHAFEKMMTYSRGDVKRMKEPFGVESKSTEVYINEKTGRVYYMTYLGKEHFEII